jgi:hypothetical protein
VTLEQQSELEESFGESGRDGERLAIGRFRRLEAAEPGQRSRTLDCSLDPSRLERIGARQML